MHDLIDLSALGFGAIGFSKIIFACCVPFDEDGKGPNTSEVLEERGVVAYDLTTP